MTSQNTGTKNTPRPDEAILEDIWQALLKQETIRAIDIHDISVNVENRQVCLSGHVSKDNNDQCIEENIWSVPGVTAVHNHLVTDHDLNIQVAQALGNDERTRPFILPVYSNHGWVKLGGAVPNRDIQRAAEETAASVPTVRGVILLPVIKGEQSTSVRDAVQPGIGVWVYGENGTGGTVYQVVINPQNRLVTHAIVRENHTMDGRKVWCDYLVPVESMQVVDEGGIFLNDRTMVISQFPVLNPANYPFASLTWQPPYPYTVGSVRWPRQQQATARQPIHSNAGKSST